MIWMRIALLAIVASVLPGKSINEERDLKLFLAVINDNFTGTMERGQKGQYIGPDDFLTVSIVFKAHIQDWRWATTYNNITSRKFEYRYDLIFNGLSKRYDLLGLVVRPELGLVWKGNCGGEKLQNWWHRGRDLPELFVPYRKGGMAAFAAAMITRPTQLSRLGEGVLTSAAEVKLISGLVPSRMSPMLGYQVALWQDRLQLETLVGARLYFNEIVDYSNLIRSGTFFGFNAKFRVYTDFYIDYGMTFFPAQNLENEPLYKDSEHNLVPQINVVFSWNSAWYRLYDYLDY